MKSLILLLTLIGTLSAVEITFNIPADKIDSLASAIAWKKPIPIDAETGQPIMTKRQWAKQSVILDWKDLYESYEKWKKIQSAKKETVDTLSVD